MQYDQGADIWIELAVVTEKSYTTEVDIISGQTYKFKVEARNEVGFSPESAELSILAATIPVTPDAPTTYISGEYVAVQWVPPYNGGTKVLAYSVQVQT